MQSWSLGTWFSPTTSYFAVSSPLPSPTVAPSSYFNAAPPHRFAAPPSAEPGAMCVPCPVRSFFVLRLRYGPLLRPPHRFAVPKQAVMPLGRRRHRTFPPCHTFPFQRSEPRTMRAPAHERLAQSKGCWFSTFRTAKVRKGEAFLGTRKCFLSFLASLHLCQIQTGQPQLDDAVACPNRAAICRLRTQLLVGALPRSRVGISSCLST